MNRKVRVRFAPSPTGLMHIGGVRTALFNYLFAKQNNGDLVLRLEDTDRERFVEEGVEQILESLKWLGLMPDEGYWLEQEKGQHGPYIQSKRLPHYLEYANKLIDEGKAYYSYTESDQINSQREQSKLAKRPFVYRHSMEPPNKSKPTEGLPIRLKVSAGTLNWRDEIRGDFRHDHDLIDDFIIVKADGYPTYNFANVVDDHMMQISHVIRGDEFIASTPKHALLYDLLGWRRPYWIHLPVINGSDGKKLSKRSGDVNVLDYRDQGYLAEALINYLALLGWNDGTEQEIFSLPELINKFDVARIQKSPAIFDIDRLNWMNGVYIREKISQEEYLSLVRKELDRSGVDLKSFSQEYISTVANLERERIKFFSQVANLLDFFFVAPKINPDLISLIYAKTSQPEAKAILEASFDELASCADDIQSIEDCLRKLARDLDIKPGQLFYPIRVAITGRVAAPGLFETISALGTKETAKRLKDASSAL